MRLWHDFDCRHKKLFSDHLCSGFRCILSTSTLPLSILKALTRNWYDVCDKLMEIVAEFHIPTEIFCEIYVGGATPTPMSSSSLLNRSIIVENFKLRSIFSAQFVDFIDPYPLTFAIMSSTTTSEEKQSAGGTEYRNEGTQKSLQTVNFPRHTNISHFSVASCVPDS